MMFSSETLTQGPKDAEKALFESNSIAFICAFA